MRHIKWFLILVVTFISSILAGPAYALWCWVGREESERFIDRIGEKLKDKLVDDIRK